MKNLIIFILYAMTAGAVFTQERTYNIGDYGPAGGIIFYDKGVFSNGWRYLEAAPAETEFIAQWGALWHDVVGTSTDVGSGKRNTELIIESLTALGESEIAAQLCAALNYGGFNDWFMPSLGELDLIYQNLKQKGLGGFSNGWYWSSSQVNDTDAWPKRFDGSQFLEDIPYKFYTNSVRAIRAF